MDIDTHGERDTERLIHKEIDKHGDRFAGNVDRFKGR